MTGLARKLMGLAANFSATYSNQWFERTLDDSAIRRMDVPQAFLLTDAILKLFVNITCDMVVYPKQIENLLHSELPFMATEKILMEAVEKGKSRQEMHEVVKEHSVISGTRVKNDGLHNDLFSRLAADDRIPFSLAELESMTDDLSQYTGRASEQTSEFLNEIVWPLLKNQQETFTVFDASLNV